MSLCQLQEPLRMALFSVEPTEYQVTLTTSGVEAGHEAYGLVGTCCTVAQATAQVFDFIVDLRREHLSYFYENVGDNEKASCAWRGAVLYQVLDRAAAMLREFLGETKPGSDAPAFAGAPRRTFSSLACAIDSIRAKRDEVGVSILGLYAPLVPIYLEKSKTLKEKPKRRSDLDTRTVQEKCESGESEFAFLSLCSLLAYLCLSHTC